MPHPVSSGKDHWKFEALTLSTTLFAVIFEHLYENSMFLMLAPAVCSMRNIAVLGHILSPSLMVTALLRCIGVCQGNMERCASWIQKDEPFVVRKSATVREPLLVFCGSHISFCAVMQQLLMRLPRWGRDTAMKTILSVNSPSSVLLAYLHFGRLSHSLRVPWGCLISSISVFAISARQIQSRHCRLAVK